MGNRVPRRLALIIWYTGALALSGKATSLVAVATPAVLPVGALPLTIVTGIGFGLLKGVWLFTPACRRNLARIDGLAHPRFWHAFRPQFWVALLAMILFAGQLSRWAQGHPVGTLAVAALDLSIATALWIGGRPFWQRR